MSYYVTLQYTDLRIPKSIFPTLCSHLLTSGFLDRKNMGGGRHDGNPDNGYGSDGRSEAWFSWCDMDQLTMALEDNDFIIVLECFRFDVILDETSGDITDLHFDCKCGDEERLFEYLAPVLPGVTRLTWSGEGGERWRWLIKDGKFRHIDGIVSFPGDDIEEDNE